MMRFLRKLSLKTPRNCVENSGSHFGGLSMYWFGWLDKKVTTIF
jgi:hypothetical protein